MHLVKTHSLFVGLCFFGNLSVIRNSDVCCPLTNWSINGNDFRLSDYFACDSIQIWNGDNRFDIESDTLSMNTQSNSHSTMTGAFFFFFLMMFCRFRNAMLKTKFAAQSDVLHHHRHQLVHHHLHHQHQPNRKASHVSNVAMVVFQHSNVSTALSDQMDSVLDHRWVNNHFMI